MAEDMRETALRYHRETRPGKIEVIASKPLANQRDLSRAYTPGVAHASTAIAEDPAMASEYTIRANLVGVVTNGTAVLGLGNIGPLASKPVMEGKAVLFKKFAGIDVFDIEVDETDIEKFVDIVAALEPTFGGINLEDIKAPECFEIEKQLRARMNIPVFHDDQHGTAIIVGAAVRNGLRLAKKDIADVRLVTSGAGAAALACVNLLVGMGLPRENVTLTDIDGVVYAGRPNGMNPYLEAYAQETDVRTLDDAIDGADIFLGLSAPGVLTPDMVTKMAATPLIFALANPTPEIMPEAAKEARPDALIASGRSDYPNQVNNVLCFPHIFRGALDVGATDINEAMKIAAVDAIANLAMQETSDVVASAYGGEVSKFGPDSIIPSPFDPRLIVEVAPAVARAAMESGVATRPITDFDAYIEQLSRFVFRSDMLMRPTFDRAKANRKVVVFAEGEDDRVLRAAKAALDEGIAQPILIGRPEVVQNRVERLGLNFRPGEDCEIINPQDDPRYRDYWTLYHTLAERSGVSPDEARTRVRTNATVIAALAVMRGDADAMICGSEGRYDQHLRHIQDIIGFQAGVREMSAVSVLILSKGTFFLTDTYVTPDPTAEAVSEMTVLAAEEVRRFGIEPRVALLSHSNFGSSNSASARKMRQAREIVTQLDPTLQVEGEMHGDAAVDPEIRAHIFPNSLLEGQANLLVMPDQDAANIAFNLLKTLADGLAVGPILVGAARSAHIVTPSVTARGLLNMCAVAAVDAQHDSHKAE
ncbi:MAG: NADP-dependent malic enzyme [Alphaproteobacteria bacterium]|nr:NADP-dependent malic enzyme [Alphaproteobacteria bacterium]